MAARKSCTHLTWAEAKAKVGGDNTAAKKKKASQKMTLTEKTIAKHSSDNNNSLSKAQVRRAQRSDEKARAAIAAEKERQLQNRLTATVQPTRLARERLRQRALQLQQHQHQQQPNDANKQSSFDKEQSISDDELEKLVECREMQLDEIMALEAVYGTEEEHEDNGVVFRIAEHARYNESVEKRQMLLEDDAKNNRVAFVSHPELSFTLELEIEDGNSSSEEMDLAAHMLLQVTLPPLYPLHGATPQFQIKYVMVTDQRATCRPDKPLETLGYLDEASLLQQLEQQVCAELLPDPCIMAVVTHLTETAFDTLELSAHAKSV